MILQAHPFFAHNGFTYGTQKSLHPVCQSRFETSQEWQSASLRCFPGRTKKSNLRWPPCRWWTLSRAGARGALHETQGIAYQEKLCQAKQEVKSQEVEAVTWRSRAL